MLMKQSLKIMRFFWRLWTKHLMACRIMKNNGNCWNTSHRFVCNSQFFSLKAIFYELLYSFREYSFFPSKKAKIQGSQTLSPRFERPVFISKTYTLLKLHQFHLNLKGFLLVLWPAESSFSLKLRPADHFLFGM